MKKFREITKVINKTKNNYLAKSDKRNKPLTSLIMENQRIKNTRNH